jgi:ceramide glucosyltransferase
MLISRLLILFAIIGLVSSTGFLVLLAVAATRFRLRRQPAPIPDSDLPPVTLLKPLCGLEPNLEANLESFFLQDYPKYEIIFGTRNSDDLALKILESVRRRYPEVPVRIVYSGDPDFPNAKVCSLEKMYVKASYDYLVMSDSDVLVTSSYIREVIRPLLDSNVGMVNCIYRGLPTGGLWSRLEALGMSIEMTSGVLVAEMLSGMTFALGPTMALRREVLDAVGGMRMLANYCADDYVLGNEIYRSGRKVVLSSHVIDHVVMNRTLRSSLLHQIRWMKSTRFSRFSGHVGSVLTFAMPWGILGAVAAYFADMQRLAVAIISWAILNRVFMAVIAGWGVVKDPRSLKLAWLYPVRDILGFFYWCASFVGDTIVWRGETYRLQPRGKMIRIVTEGETQESAVVAVNNLS